MKFQVFFLFSALWIFTLTSCSSPPELASSWRKPEQADSLPYLNYFEKEKIAVGFSNDSAQFSITIKTIDRETQDKIIRGGLTVWFDPTGGEKKTFGIHFPMGAGGLETTSAPTHIRGSREEANETNDYSLYEKRLGVMMQTVEIIGPGPVDKEQLPVATSFKTHNIKVDLLDTMGTTTYHLTVPMKILPATPLAIGTEAGKEIGIGILAASLRRTPQQSAGTSDMPGNGYGEGRGGMGGGGRRGGGGERNRGGSSERNSTIELWMKVKVAG